MKWMIPTALAAVTAVALAVFTLSIPTTLVANKAYASKMDGKPYGAHARTNRAACFNGACRRK
jgi:hypothetical protein